MLIRVLLENKEGDNIIATQDCTSIHYACCYLLLWLSFAVFAEGLFNADCQAAFLLDAIKRRHKLPQSGIYMHMIYTA